MRSFPEGSLRDIHKTLLEAVFFPKKLQSLILHMESSLQPYASIEQTSIEFVLITGVKNKQFIASQKNCG